MYNVGDRVRILRGTNAKGELDKGTILYIDNKNESLPYFIKLDNGSWEWEDEVNLERVGLKHLLKTNRVVEIRNGDRFRVLRDVDTSMYGRQEVAFVGLDRQGFLIGSEYNDDLTDEDLNEYDIVAIYQESINDSNILNSNTCTDTGILSNSTHLVWKRDVLVDVYMVKGQHFGHSKIYTWISFEDLNLKSGDIALVNTRYGDELIKVTECVKTKLRKEDLEQYKQVKKKVGDL